MKRKIIIIIIVAVFTICSCVEEEVIYENKERIAMSFTDEMDENQLNEYNELMKKGKSVADALQKVAPEIYGEILENDETIIQALEKTYLPKTND